MIKEEKEYHNIIAKNIRILRKSAKISQEKMAENLGVSREFISRVENNRERISLNTLLKIADYFNISPSQLFIQT